MHGLSWQRWSAVAVVFGAWLGLAAWQFDEYRHDRDLARETLRLQAETVTNALIGGIRSHRRLGCFLTEQLQEALDELAQSEDVRAVGLVSADGRLRLWAGQKDAAGPAVSVPPGETWVGDAFRRVTRFELEPGQCPLSGGGGGRGGRGWGHGRGWACEEAGPLAEGGTFHAVLVLDAGRFRSMIRSAAWHHSLIAAAGGMILGCLALAWRATYRLAEARGQTTLLEAEARHLRDLSQAAAGLAHETRNPLGLIRGWAQRLADSPLPTAEQQEQAEAVVEECDRVTARINQFIAFARPRRPEMAPFPPAAVVDELTTLLEPDLESRRQRIERAALPAEAAVHGDRELFRQALFNLLQNALEFTPEGGAVEVALRTSPAGRLRVEVADRGPGVPAHEVPRLFTPYHTTRPGGTGLGLAMVRHIAIAHGWQAGYAPRPGGGAIFWLDGLEGAEGTPSSLPRNGPEGVTASDRVPEHVEA